MGQTTEKIFERAKVNLEENNHEHALRLFNEVLNREPRHLKALRSKALIKIMNAPQKEAEEFLLFAINQQPDDDQLHQMLGTFYHNNENPHKALAQFEKALKINGKNLLSLRGLGIIYAHFLGEHEKAINYFSKGLNIEQSADLYFDRGCSYMICDNLEKAEQDLRKAADLGHQQAEEMISNYFE